MVINVCQLRAERMIGGWGDRRAKSKPRFMLKQRWNKDSDWCNLTQMSPYEPTANPALTRKAILAALRALSDELGKQGVRTWWKVSSRRAAYETQEPG